MPTISIRENMPAINVKDRVLWANELLPTGPLIAELSEEVVTTAYEEAQQQFWHDAKGLAGEFGYGEDNVFSAGRSGGWLCIDGTSFMEYIVNEDGEWHVPSADDTADDDTAEEYASVRSEFEKFKRFAENIVKAQEQAGERFLELLREAKADLDERREAAIVLGEN